MESQIGLHGRQEDSTLHQFSGHFVAAQISGGRERQDDDFAIVHFQEDGVERLIMVVADGMGGHAGAAEVAQIGVKGFCDAMKAGQGSLAARLRPALEHANGQIALAGARDPNVRGAGCTLVAAAIEGNVISWISIGDSLLYLFRNRILRRLNEIPSALSGAFNQARAPSSSAQLLPGLKGAELPFVSISPQPLRILPYDGILLASDGLDCLGDRNVERILRRTATLDLETVVRRLLSSVSARPLTAQDNTTILFCRVPASEGVMNRRFPWLRNLGRWKLSWLV